MMWPWSLRVGHASPEAHEALSRACADLDTARRRGPEVEELRRCAEVHLSRNHFGQQITDAMERRT